LITLYSGAADPRSQLVRLVLAEKAVEARVVDCDLLHPPEDLLDLSPVPSLPTLVDRDLVVYEPQIIAEYLDERYPHPPLLPADPGPRAQARVALHRIERDWYSLVDGLEGADGGRDAPRARKLLRESLVASEPLFRARAWFLSDQYSLLDAAVLPILWRLPRWEIALPDAAAQAIQRYLARGASRPSFRRALSDAELEMRR